MFGSRLRLTCLSDHFDRIDACVRNIIESGCFSSFAISCKLENRLRFLIGRLIDFFSRFTYLKSLKDLTDIEVAEIKEKVNDITSNLATMFQFVDDIYIDYLERRSNSEDLEANPVEPKKRGRKPLASDPVLIEIAKRVNDDFKLTSDQKGFKFQELFQQHTGRKISLERAKRNLRNLSRLSPSQTASVAP